jgi:hypothetical protein
LFTVLVLVPVPVPVLAEPLDDAASANEEMVCPDEDPCVVDGVLVAAFVFVFVLVLLFDDDDAIPVALSAFVDEDVAVDVAGDVWLP